MSKNLCSICIIVLTLGLLVCSVKAGPPDIQWTRIADLPGDQHAACAAVIDGKVYMVGGQNPPGPPNYNKMRIYDPCTNSWSNGTSMPTRRYWPASGVLENCTTEEKELYVVGGYSGYAGLSTVEKYTPSTGNWQPVPPITGNRGHGIMTAVVDNNLYAIGGFYNHGICYNTNEMYNHCSNTWTMLAPMPVAMQAGSPAVWHDKIYIFGGWAGQLLTNTFIYDTSSGTWSEGAEIPRTRNFGGAVTFGDYIYLIGGAGCSNIIDVYDPVNDSWSTIDDYPGSNSCSPVITQSSDLVYVLADSYQEPGKLECWVGQISLLVLVVEIDINPNTLNLQSKGRWITCYIWLPEEYDVADIDSTSIVLEDEIEAEWVWLEEEEQVVMAKFDRSEVQDILEPGKVELTVSWELTDGTKFEATDTIRVIDKGGKKK